MTGYGDTGGNFTIRANDKANNTLFQAKVYGMDEAFDLFRFSWGQCKEVFQVTLHYGQDLISYIQY